MNFIEGAKILRQECKGCHVSGGLSNLSFSFRGLEALREAFHSVFLFHAIQNGMDMGIVNAGKLPVYDDIEPELRKILEEVIWNRSEDGHHVDRLINYAQRFKDELDAAKAGGTV